MSVIIKNMQMPKNCDECSLIHADGWNTCFLTGLDASEDVRPDWCPLEPYREVMDNENRRNRRWD